ncbi:MAG: LysR family transcriptional regulator [Bdellovibrionota bacterium]
MWELHSCGQSPTASKSSVSRAVSRLERESGTKLLMRTTRSVTLTAAGRAFYDSCIGPLQQLDDAENPLLAKTAFSRVS